jgi:hypothetical protein
VNRRDTTKPLARLSLSVRSRGPSLDVELADAVRAAAMQCCARSLRVAVDGEIHEVAAAENRRYRMR